MGMVAISKPAMVFRDGEFIELPPVSEEEYYLFPEPIGWAKTHLSLHSEVATVPLSLADKGIRECFFKSINVRTKRRYPVSLKCFVNVFYLTT